jgi:hypothetical protein
MHPRQRSVANLPKPQPDNNDIDGEWEDLIKSVEIDDIPLDMIKVLRVHHNNGNRYVFNIKDWLDNGASLAKIQRTVDDWYRQHGEDIAGSDFIIDLDKIKKTVTEQTKKTLKDL